MHVGKEPSKTSQTRREALFVRDAIFPHYMMIHVATFPKEIRLARQKDYTLGFNITGEKREVRLVRQRLVANGMLHDSATNDEHSV